MQLYAGGILATQVWVGKHPRFVCFNEVDTAVIASARLSLYIWRGVICNFLVVNRVGKIVSFGSQHLGRQVVGDHLEKDFKRSGS